MIDDDRDSKKAPDFPSSLGLGGSQKKNMKICKTMKTEQTKKTLPWIWIHFSNEVKVPKKKSLKDNRQRSTYRSNFVSGDCTLQFQRLSSSIMMKIENGAKIIGAEKICIPPYELQIWLQVLYYIACCKYIVTSSVKRTKTCQAHISWKLIHAMCTKIISWLVTWNVSFCTMRECT